MSLKVSRRHRFLRLMSNSFEALIALFSLIAVFQYFFDPAIREASPLTEILGNGVIAWSIMYAFAGLITFIGLWQYKINI
jgi:hypothetical protein